jgi:hypothetical protein
MCGGQLLSCGCDYRVSYDLKKGESSGKAQHSDT